MNDFLFSGRLIKACAPILALGLLNSSMTWAQAPAKLWDQRYGGTLPDGLETVVATTDGGSLLAGTTASSATGDQSRPRKGSVADYWVVKITATGAKQWEHNFGGANYQHLRAAVQTRDGGYLLGGFSASNASHDKSQNSRGTDDFWIVKLDAQGNKEWDRTYGGNNTDRLMALQQTADGGYVLGGTSASGSGGDKTDGGRGDRDYWVVKIDAVGVKQWDKTLGSRGGDYLFALQQTRDGGYLLGGESRGGVGADKTEPSWGGDDMWVVKLDAQGAREWDKTVGSFGDEELRVVRQLPGGHYLLGGASDGGPDGDKTQGSNGLKDYWLVELAANGNKLRDQAWGGSDFDRLAGLELLPDGGLLLGGYSRSGAGGDKTHPSRGDYDYWVVRLDAQGRKRWDQSVGSAAADQLTSLHRASDGGIVLGGYTNAGMSGDKTQASRGGQDYWVVKLALEVVNSTTRPTTQHPLEVYPNPARQHLTLRLAAAAPRAGLRLTLYDAAGRTVWARPLPPAAGLEVPVQTGARPAGLYLLCLEGPQGYRVTQRVQFE